MYQVNLGDQILYYPANADFAIYDVSLSESVGLAGEFSFKVPPQNPLYNQLTTGALVTILKDGVEMWRGEIREIDTDFAKVADVYCVEDLAWLADEFMTPALMNTESYAQRFQAAITAYNQNRTADRQFTAGYITNVQSTDLCTWATEYDWSILDDIRNCIAKDTGYLRVRRVTSGGVVTRYIDCVRLADYGVQATQHIEYGYNLLDYVKESDYGNLTNVLTPYGDELDSEVYEGYSARLAGTPIQNDDSIATYGRHARAVIFDGVTDLPTLNSLAAAYLTRYCQPALTMEVEAVDLGAIENVSELKLGDSIRVIAQPFAVDQWLYLTEIKRDLQNIDKNKITLSGHVTGNRTLTSQANSTADFVKNMPSKSSILEAAKRNAKEILDGTNGGSIYFSFDENGRIIEQGFTNNVDLEQATAISRWNINGKAIMTRENPGDEWTVRTAETIDGGIVADFITSGSLTLGNGGSNDAPLLQAYSGNTLVTKINRDGLYATAGTVGGFVINPTSISKGLGNDYAIELSNTKGYAFAAYLNGLDTPTWSKMNNYIDRTGAAGRTLAMGLFLHNSGIRIDNSGNLSDSGSDATKVLNISYANMTKSETGGGYYTVHWDSSDRRLKEDILPLGLELSKALVDALETVSFKYKGADGKHYGMIAQDVREILDGLGENDAAVEHGFDVDGKEFRAIDYKEFIPHLINYVQDLRGEVDALKEEINKMKGAR